MLLKFFGWLTALALAVFSWSQLVAPPIVQLRAGDKPEAVMLALLDPLSTEVYADTPFGGWAFLLVTFAVVLLMAIAARSIILYVVFSRTPVSVLATNVTVTFDGPGLHRATIKRHQLIHANRSRVQAYRATVTTTQPGAYIDVPKTSFQSELCGQDITDRVIDVGNHSSRDIIEIFKKPLISNFFITYLPNEAVLMMKGIFKKHIVERTTLIEQVGEFDVENAHFALNAIRYPVTNVELSFVFPAATAPDRGDFVAFLISDNAARKLDALQHLEGGNVRYCVKQDTLINSTLLVTWDNKKLVAWKVAQASGPAPAGGTKKKSPAKRTAPAAAGGATAAGARRPGPTKPAPAAKPPRGTRKP